MIALHSTEIETAPAILPHPGSEGYGALICPKCATRCGFLFRDEQCLACEVNWTDPKPQEPVEYDTLAYSCRCGREWPVLIERENGGAWLITSGDDERCPGCGQFGLCDEDDPDTFWNAAERAAESEAEDWLEPSLSAWERNR